ncbi:MAG: ABC transporter permease subunit [Acholeplasmataceae bacterium]
MSNIDLILNSYNIKQQNKIFKELDKIQEAKALYFELSNETKQAFIQKIKPHKVKVDESKVHLKYLKEEIYQELKKSKETYKKTQLQLKEDYKLQTLEITDASKLHIQKLNSIVKQKLQDYDKSISKEALDLNIDEDAVVEIDAYIKANDTLQRKHDKTVLNITKAYYIREKRLYYKYLIMNAKDKQKAKQERDAFLDYYQKEIKNNPGASLQSLQEALILSDNYKYHLNDLKAKHSENKQKLINKTYKEHQRRLLKEKLQGIKDKDQIEAITNAFHETDIIHKRILAHQQHAKALKQQRHDFLMEAEALLQKETTKTNEQKEKDLEAAKLTCHKKLEDAKNKHESFKTSWHKKYFSKENNYLKQEKIKHKEIIKANQAIIKQLKLEMKEAIQKEKPLREKLQHDKTKTITEAQAVIKELQSEQKAYYESLSIEDKKAYNQMEKYARQERRERRKTNFDNVEKKVFKKINPAYIYVIPAYLSVAIFTLFPFFFMTVGSFFKINLTNLELSQFLGFTNYYNSFFKDREFQMSLYNTLIYSLMTVGLLSVVTISMAAWLHRDTKIHNATQTMVFTPHIASFVAISILWIAMLRPDGLINQFLAIFGIKGPGWLIQTNTALLSISFVTVWKDMGYYILIIISGLQSIPAYVYEAAKLDKASKKTQFFKLTLPLLTPTLSFVFVTKFINSFKVFAPIEIMTNGGPLGSSMVLSYWIYKMGRVGYNYGTAMAGAVVLTLIIASFTLVNNRFSRRTIRYY